MSAPNLDELRRRARELLLAQMPSGDDQKFCELYVTMELATKAAVALALECMPAALAPRAASTEQPETQATAVAGGSMRRAASAAQVPSASPAPSPAAQRCGAYMGDNYATTPQLTCIRGKGHPGLHDQNSDQPDPPRALWISSCGRRRVIAHDVFGCRAQVLGAEGWNEPGDDTELELLERAVVGIAAEFESLFESVAARTDGPGEAACSPFPVVGGPQ